MDKLDSEFGGRNSAGFDYEAYGQWMKEDDKKISDLISSEFASPIPSITSESLHLSPNNICVAYDEDDYSSCDETTSNLESAEKRRTQSLPPLSCKDVANSETAEVAKELKQSELE